MNALSPAPLLVILLTGCDATPSGGTSTESAYQIDEAPKLYFVNDAGVADLDHDGGLELWTLNHSARQISWDSSEGWSYRSPLRLGLAPTPALPTMTAQQESRLDCDKPSTIQYVRTRLEMRSFSDDMALAGSIQIPWPSTVRYSGNVLWKPEPGSPGIQGFSSGGRFVVRRGGVLEVEPTPPPSDGFPLQIVLDEDIALAEVGFGWGCDAPLGHELKFNPKDRHGLAVADVFGSPKADLFISRGGARGDILRADPSAADELFVWGGSTYSDMTPVSKIEKEGCPGRQVAWFDVDRDGDLDLYQVCGRGGGRNSDAPNRLYVQEARGSFTERAAEFGLDFEKAGTFAWVPVRHPSPPRMIWATSDRLDLMELRGSRYVRTSSISTDRALNGQLSLQDIDDDQKFELLVVSRQGNEVFEIEESGLARSPVDLGEFGGSSAGGFVDYDADGQIEIFLVPQGILERNAAGAYMPTSLLALDGMVSDARANWLDLDNDGDLDLWLLTKSYPAPTILIRFRSLLPRSVWPTWDAFFDVVGFDGSWYESMWDSRVFFSKTHKGNICAIDIVGAPGNQESIGAIADIWIEGNQRTAFVGQSEGARFSQSHYRIYSGCSKGRGIDSIRVEFHDGAVVEELSRTSAPLLVCHPDAIRPECDLPRK